MTATWILIVYISAATGGPTIAEFFTKERCEAAGQAVEEKFGGFYSSARWICVEK